MTVKFKPMNSDRKKHNIEKYTKGHVYVHEKCT